MGVTTAQVLIVEDDRVLRRASAVSLRQRGFRVRTAADGEEGLKLIQEERPDLVLLDLVMPGIGGLEVLRRLREDEATRDMPVVILSNSSRESAHEEAERLGISGYWIKAQLSLSQLSDLVHRVVEG